MTDPRTPGQGSRPLRPLLDEAPGNEPPAWLDANIRAEAARVAGLARQQAGKAPRAVRSRMRRGWLPIGATMAVAVLGLLLVIGTPVPTPAPSPQTPPAPATAPTPTPTPESRNAASADLRPKTRDDSTAPAAGAKKEGVREEAEARSAPAMLGRAREGSAERAAPDSAAKCVEQTDELRRDQRIDEAKRLLRACRERFPEHEFPAALIRELAP
ncbi:MAG: hypothetical protein KJZ83_10895 [Burkholderiaceae bacterium]|nr:hypothetical protein [Burkholderiaceae bacterium]